MKPSDKTKDFEKLFNDQSIFRNFCAYPFQGIIQNPNNKMRIADRIVKVVLHLDEDDIQPFDEDEFDSHLERYLELIAREPVMSIIEFLKKHKFIKGGLKGKGDIFSPALKEI